MANLFNIVRAFGRISSHSLASVSQERCLNRRYNRVFCNKCEHVCCTDAISFDTVPDIDGVACTGCGICINVCPTGALSLKDISKKYILSSIEEGRKVVFSCRSAKESDNISYVTVPCIGYLCEGMLIKAASMSEKLIIDRTCDHCTLKIDFDLLQRKVEVANAILESFGRNPNIELLIDSTANVVAKDAFGRKSIGYLRNVYGGNDKDEDTDKNKSDAGDTVNSASGVESSDGMSIIPPTHKLLIDAISALGEPVSDLIMLESGPFYSFDIVDTCDMCGICAAICPTGALRLSESESEPMQSIEFNISFCIGCDVCRQVCKKNAVSYKADIHLSDIMSSDWISLISHEIMQCKCCKKYIKSIKKDELCSSCSLEQDVEQQFLQ